MRQIVVVVLCGLVVLWGFQVALSLDPLDQAQLFIESGNEDQAIAILEPLLTEDQDPEHLGDVVELLDTLLVARGEMEKAITVLRTYISRFPNASRTPLFTYWMAQHEEDRGNSDRALALLEELLRTLPPEDPLGLRLQVLSDLAYLFRYRKGDFRKALAMYEEIAERAPDPEERLQAKMSCGLCLEALGEYERALALYRDVARESPGSFFERWAKLRIVYLTEPPKERFPERDALLRELKQAFERRDLSRLKELVKRGDFWSGVNFSEFDVGDASEVLTYLARYLPASSHLSVSGEAIPRDGEWVVRVEEWGDPEYNILYLVLAEGRYGWEWKGVILSSTTLEACENNENATR